MLRTKKDVDRHVQDIFRKLQDENEKTLRCYKIAELYYHVSDYESARRYLSRYVEVRKEAKAHKLMGQILEALGQKESALVQYKFAFELDARQEDLILKVCELMADPEVGIDINRAKYWVERTERLFSRHKIVFQLKEKILSIERPVNNEEDLENLITAELAVRPSDVQLRVKLLKHYMEKNKFAEAYKHATDIEMTNIHRDSLQWYQILCELFLKCKSSKQSNWSFWITYISSLERYAALALRDQSITAKKTSEAIQAVYNFDQHLFEAKGQSFTSYPSLTETIFVHMWGQLHFHMACLLLQDTKREQSSWSEAGRLCAPLLLTAMHVKPIDLTASWATHLDNSMKNQVQLLYREGSYRCSQAGHVLLDYSRGNQKKLISNIEKFCTGSWRERIYQRIFVGKIYQKVRTSYFTNNNALNPSLRLVSQNELKRYDEVAEEVWPYSLHHQIWPAIKTRNSGMLYSNKHEGPQPNLSSHLFPELQFSVYNTNQASPATICRLDIDAFLNATALCASAVVEEQQQNNLLSPDRLPTLPADLTNPLCTKEQEKWWSSAYKIYRREKLDDIGETRQCLQRGLEVVRCIGNHGLHPTILVHLARAFDHRAKQLKEKNSESGDISALESRSELYWSAAVPLLERLQNNQTIRSSNVKLFEYIGGDMNNMELTRAIEEGKLLLVQKLVRDKLYEQAIEALQALKCPEASFEQGKIYKKLADDTISSLSKENLTSEMRSQHVIILSKARNCFYLTLDRLRSPDADPKHPLNAELCTHITLVENELKRIDPDTLYSDRNRNECDDLSDESYSSAHSDEHPLVTNSIPINNSLQTPIRSIRRIPRQSSTPRQNQDILDISRNRNEARPSPERLDAQIRQLVHSIESLKEQNREQHRAMISKLDELIKISARKENQKSRPQAPVNNHNLEEDLYGIYNEENYGREYNNYSNTSLPTTGANRTAAIVQNLFAASAQRHPYSSLVYPSPAATAAVLQGYYQGGHLPFADPAAATAAAAAGQHIPSLYPAAAAGVYPMSSLYRSGLEQPIASMQQMTESVLQHGLFAQRLSGQPITQLPDYTQTQPLPPQQQQQLGQQINQLSINESIKSDSKLGYTPTNEPNPSEPLQSAKEATSTVVTTIPTATRKAPPVNVVITTSDTLPTTAPAVQPTLSVTIPAQHRLGVSPATSTTVNQSQELTISTTPHSYQISMPSQPTIPTTVNLPPLSTTITVTSPLIKSQVTDNQNSSILSTGSRHSNSDSITEVEHDPIPDFAPIIPLPDEVPVTTGEENEETLFCARAKLFRFVDKEWKERGIGNVKLLKNTDGKVRLLMRREQVHKICANHMLRKDMELSMMPNNNKAYMWVANDYADEEVKLEKLCIRFKTPEEATDFKEHFDKARNSLPDNKSTTAAPIKTSTSTDKAKPVKSETVENKKVEKLGGFSFTSSPIIEKPTAEAPNLNQKKQEEAKPSPFASFSFVKSTDATKTPTTSTGLFNFGSPNVTGTQAPIFGQDQIKNILRRPHAPAPIEATKEDGEVIVMEESISFTHYGSDTKVWNDKGTVSIKILSEKSSGRVRLLMTKNDNAQTVYDQIIAPSTVFNIKADAINWTIASDKNKSDSYLARFKNYDQASLFQKTIMSHLQGSNKPSNKQDQKPLSELFKPAAGSWECKDCYTRNNVTAAICVSCQAPSPIATIAPSTRPTAQSLSKNLFEQFKPPADSWECQACYSRNNAGTSSCIACEAPAPFAGKATTTPASTPASTSSVNKPLSELFKPVAGFWECNLCCVVNTQSNVYCAACDAPKDPSMPPKPKAQGGFLINSQTPETKSTFSFGIPQSCQSTTSKESNGFNFNLSKSSEKVVSSPINIFGSNKTATPNTSGFLFGTQSSNTPPNSGGDTFTFGSPGKSFDFQFQAKSPPIKSPERPETSDDEVVEEAEDVYFPPVIPLPDKVDVKTGEENEDILYSHRAKLFKFDTATKEWKERGLGDIKLLRHMDTKKLRLVMRRDQVLKLCLNHAVTSTLEISSKDDKTWMWSAGDYSEGEIEYIQFACRFKTPEIAEEFKKSVDDACKELSTETNNTTVATAAVATKKDSTQDIEVVYEIKVSAEEKTAALALQLPENFYAYKYKPDCPGCIGCKDDDESLFKADKSKQSASPKSSGPTLVKAGSATPSTTSQSILNNVFGKPTMTATTIASTQPTTGLKMTFGTSTPAFGSTTSTGFVFGSQPTFTKPDSQETDLENLKICGPTTKSQTSVATTTATTLASTNIFSGFTSVSSNSVTSVSAKPLFSTSLFSAPETTVSVTPVKNVFGSSTPLFGDTKSVFEDSKNSTIVFREPKLQTNNIFGGTSTLGTAATTTTNIFGGTSTTNMFSGASSLGPTVPATTNIFDNTTPSPMTNLFGGTSSLITATTTASSSTSNSIFSSSSTLFGGQTNVTSFGSLAPQGNAQGSQIGSFGTNIFGNTANTKSTTTPTSTSIFSGDASKQFSSKISFGNNTANSASNAFSNPFFQTSSNIFTTKPAENNTKKEDISFLPTDNSLSFSALATQTTPTEQAAFKKDPNFTFDGAGTSVFGSKSEKSTLPKTQSKTSNVKKEKEKDEDGEEGDEDNENGEEHDPYFEPVVPLPDAIEVRTGEEDEENLFCRRAKLYRYDQNTKEWKERGTGEMKLLHHVEHGTFRILLRREQVHKVVCNMLLTADLEFRELNSSDRAWVWAGMNYAEPENAEVEKLAVKFKSPELAGQFKEAVDKAQLALLEKLNQDPKVGYEVNNPEDEYEHYYPEGDEYVDEDEDEDEDEEAEEDDLPMKMFEKRATLYAQNEGESAWKTLAMGNLKALYDSDIFGVRIIFENDNNEIISDTVISMNTSMERIDKECIWAAIDYALEPSTRRILRAVFSSTQTSQEMYQTFQEGQEYATKANIRE